MPQKITDKLLDLSLPFWKQLSQTEKTTIINHSVLHVYKPGALIHNCSDKSSAGVQIIVHGRARIFINSPDGKQLTLQRIEDNQLFSIGVSCVLDNTIFDVSLETETKCEVVLIPRTICKKLYDTNDAVRKSVIGILVSRFAHTMRILEAITFTSTRSRLANSLIEQGLLSESSQINVTHASIAMDLGTTREVVTRILHQFQREGFVTLHNRKIIIKNKQALINIRGDHLEYISNLIYPKPSKKDE
jgi:CRP/FNR family transcriptional regulator